MKLLDALRKSPPQWDGARIGIEYAVEDKHNDWNCDYCNSINYHWRKACYHCLAPHKGTASPNIEEASNSLLDASQDISKVPTRFIILDSIINTQMTLQCAYEALCEVANFERIWVPVDIQTSKMSPFLFMEFHSIQDAEASLYKFGRAKSEKLREAFGTNGPLDIYFGRDLLALNQLLSQASPSSEMKHWNPLVKLLAYPPLVQEASPPNSIDIPKNNPANTAFSLKPTQNAPKKLKVNFKGWVAASEAAAVADSDKVNRPTQELEVSSADVLALRIKLFLDPILKKCLLCNENFETLEALQEHETSSTIHEENLDQYLLKLSEASNEDLMWLGISQRDRAAERRLISKFAYSDESEPAEHGQETNEMSSEQPRIKTIGEKLLEKYGWRHGLGLGLTSQGITEPIKASGNAKQRAGLGADTSALVIKN